MMTVPIAEAKDKLSGLVDEAATTHACYTITRHGVPAAVLVSADDFESLQETIFWLSQPGIREIIAEAKADIAAGRTFTEDEVRARYSA